MTSMVLGLGLFIGTGAGAADAVINSSRPGNQVLPAVSIGAQGGYVVWQDDAIDGSGWGIGLRRLGANLAVLPASAVRVNVQTSRNQENPDVACLTDGSGLVVWQGGKKGQQDVYGRVISGKGSWLTGEFFVNSHRVGNQSKPAVAALADGKAVVVWTSQDQAGSYRAIYGQRLSKTGSKLGGEFRLSHARSKEDDGASVAGLANGGFVAAWSSASRSYWLGSYEPPAGEQLAGAASKASFSTTGDAVLVVRLYNALGQEMGQEILVSERRGLAENVNVASIPSGFVVAWTDRLVRQAFVRLYDGSGVPQGAPMMVAKPGRESQTIAVTATSSSVFVGWSENEANSTFENTFVRQYDVPTQTWAEPTGLSSSFSLRHHQPALASDEAGRVRAVWSGYASGNAFDIFGKQLP